MHSGRLNARDGARSGGLVLRSRVLFILIGLLATGSVAAAVIAPRDLYESEVVVEQQNPTDRDALLSQALGQVLVRVTGNRDVLTQKPAQDLQKEAVRYVQQFGYERRPVPIVPPSTTPVPAPVLPSTQVVPAGIQVFVARFDASALTAQLRASGLPVWGRERPTTLVWLAVQDAGSRWLVNSETAATEAPTLIRTALERGLPLQLPNPPGVNTPDVLDIMQGVTERLLTISRSYGVSRIVLARISQAGTQWSGSWTLVEEGQPQQTWQLSALSLDAEVADGVHHIADQYATRYAVLNTPGTTGQRSSVRLLVSGIQSINDYARVSKYLASLSTETSITLVEVTGSGASYQLSVQGDRNALRQTVALGSMLEADAGETSAEDGAALKYHLKAESQ